MQQIGKIAKNYPYKDKKGKYQHRTINAIPNNMEKYMAFMLGNHLTFINSFQFMSSSLDRLVSLPKDNLICTLKGKKLDLMSKKVCIHTTFWIFLKSSIKLNYQLRSIFIVS